MFATLRLNMMFFHISDHNLLTLQKKVIELISTLSKDLLINESRLVAHRRHCIKNWIYHDESAETNVIGR